MEICESAELPNAVYVVELIGLLNEGAVSDEGGTYKNGDSCWRFKHSRYVCVEGCKEAREAIAFVVALGLANSISVKEWPHKVSSLEGWFSSLDLESAEYGTKNLVHVNPKDMKASKVAMAAV